MAYQALQGVQITPKGSNNRFVNQNWQPSQAFGGWIFKADCNIGFSDKPTEIRMQVIIESNSNINTLTPQTFDIYSSDLQCGAFQGGAQNESLYDINFNGALFQDFVLFSYDLDVTTQQKTLSVTFRDYSVILDKIYIGLTKRQGIGFLNTAQASGIIPAVCPDCEFNSFTGSQVIVREIDFASCVGINGKEYNNFANVPVNNDVIGMWDALYNTQGTLYPSFDLNGGYVILGTEQMYSDVCSTLPEVKYKLHDLITSLRLRGLNFAGAFTGGLLVGTPYMQSYVGTLREVLNNWSSDFGMQFFTSGKTFWGIDMRSEVDISRILTIADPTTSFGSIFNTGQIALGNYKESFTLENTFKQAVITADVRPKQVNSESRDVKTFVSFQPLHPLDFYSPDWTPLYSNVLQNTLSTTRHFSTGVQFANDITKTHKRLDNFTNRLFRDIDTCMALGKYDKDLRDIFCADRAISSEEYIINTFGLGILDGNNAALNSKINGTSTPPEVFDFYANFSALGFIPQLKLKLDTSKEAVIQKFMETLGQNISLNPDFYEIYIGYYYADLKSQVVQYEGTWANSLYKYGVLNIGTTATPPFVIRSFSDWAQPADGLSGTHGATLTKVSNSFTPSADVYPIYQTAPYYDLLPYHIIGFNPNSFLGSSLNNIGFDSYNYYIGSLNNEWGTLDSDFKLQLYNALVPVCEQMFPGQPSLQTLKQNLPEKVQQWNIGDFAPKFYPIADSDGKDNLYNQLKTELDNLPENVTDELGFFAVGTDSKVTQECAKLHVCIVPNIKTHPNARVTITPSNQYYDSFNTIMARTLEIQFKQNHLNLMLEKPHNICEWSPITQVCNSGILKSGEAYPTDPAFACNSLDDSISILYAGWPSGFAYGYNARTLNITVERNPVTAMDGVGTDGEYYYDAELQSKPQLVHSTASASIIYPISNKPNDLFEYIGLMNTTISREIRTPTFTEIYGNPVSETGNNTATIKIINNTINPALMPVLNPNTARFITYATVYTGQNGGAGGTVLYTISGYHNFVSGLNAYQSEFPVKSASFSVIGSPNMFGPFSGVLTPLSGLTSFTVSIGDNGVETSLSFANKPPVLPKMEAILNNIGPRLKPA